MPSLTIPKSAYAAIQHLIHFSASDFEAFLDALSRAEPSLDQDKFWSHVAAHVKHVDQAVVKSIVHEIFEMDDARTEMEINEFAESRV